VRPILPTYFSDLSGVDCKAIHFIRSSHFTTSSQFGCSTGVCASLPQVSDLIGAAQFTIIPFWSGLGVSATAKPWFDLFQPNGQIIECSLMCFPSSSAVFGSLSRYSNISNWFVLVRSSVVIGTHVAASGDYCQSDWFWWVDSLVWNVRELFL
jgi:hypothetical protein